MNDLLTESEVKRIEQHKNHPKITVLTPDTYNPTHRRLQCVPCEKYLIDLPLCGVSLRRKKSRFWRTCRHAIRIDLGYTETCWMHSKPRKELPIQKRKKSKKNITAVGVQTGIKFHDKHEKSVYQRPNDTHQGELYCIPCRTYLFEVPLCGYVTYTVTRVGTTREIVCKTPVRIDLGEGPGCPVHPDRRIVLNFQE